MHRSSGSRSSAGGSKRTSAAPRTSNGAWSTTSPTSRAGLLELMGRSDPLTGDAVQTILERDGFIRPLPDEGPPRPLLGGAAAPIETDPAIVTELIGHSEASIAAAERDIRTKS